MRDWENLRYFLVVARKGTVSGAAKELGVSHSTVLRRIEQFERALGSKLFKKIQRGYELTVAGEHLYDESRHLEMEVDGLLSRAEGHYDAIAGKLRISQPEMGVLNVYPLYSEYQRQHPETTLEIYSTMSALNINQLEVDIALRIADQPPDLLVGRCLGTIKAKIYASKNYLKRLPKNYTANDFDWVIWQMSTDGNARKWFREHIQNPRVVLNAASMPDVVSAVTNDMGVGFLSSHEAQKHKNLVELFDGLVVAEYKLWILTHRDLRNSERVKSFMRFMSEHLQV